MSGKETKPYIALTTRLKQFASIGFGNVTKQLPDVDSDLSLSRAAPSELVLDLDDPEQSRLGDYELLEMIGQGGMGVVYRARQVSLDREVAVKLLAAGPWASTDFVERFRQEAQSAARMQHSNIVGIHEIGKQDDLCFFSMCHGSP